MSLFSSHKLLKNFIGRKPTEKYDDYIVEGIDKEHYLDTMYGYLNWYLAQDTKNVTIMSDDGLKLYASLLMCPNSKNFVIGSHSLFGCGINDFAPLSEFYHNLGFNMLLPDHRTQGKSEGEYVSFGAFEKNDLIKWIYYILDRFGSDSKIILHGVSMGATTSLLAGSMNLPDNVKAIISDCAFTDPISFLKYQLGRHHLPANFILNPLFTKIISKYVEKCVGINICNVNTIDSLKKSSIPILFIHGDQDDIVPVDMCYKNFEACNSEKKMLIVKNATHAKSHYIDTTSYESAVKDYINKYVTNTTHCLGTV